MCDIAEMYLQVFVNQQDRQYLRFLWRKEMDVKTFEFSRVVFGVNASPFLAQLVTRENAERFKSKWPRAVETILESTYMDDCMDSVETVEEAIKMRTQLLEIWKSAGMQAKKWATNSSEVLNVIPEQDRTQVFRVCKNDDIVMKTLGVKWFAQEDRFGIESKVNIPLKLTKRSFLSVVAQIFDPLGLVSPFVIRGKIILQEMWIAAVDWDDELPEI